MTVLVTDGEQIPADLEVTEGESACDESNLTGEAVPVAKRIGDRALAGTINVSGVIHGKVLRPASESSLQRIIRMIQNAQSLKAPAQRFSDRFGSGYTWTVLSICTAMFFIWWLALGLTPFERHGGQPSAFYRAMTLLVVLSPCALVLSVPSAILSAIATGARRGVLFRGGGAVETLADVSVVALDKTGTLTTGDLRLAQAVCLRGDEARFRLLAVSLARLSEHPLSRSVRRLAADWGIAPIEAASVKAHAGRGIEALIDGAQAVLGSCKLAESTFGLIDGGPENGGAAQVWVADARTMGVLFFTDEIRDSAAAMLAELKDEGVRTVVLTGDQHAAAQALARRAGVAECRAEMLPEQKLEAIEELKAGGKIKVAMIGDGVNDAPCLAAADVGVAMGARGSDAALEQADVVLMNDRLESFLLARAISRKAREIIHQNVAISLGTLVLMAISAFLFPIPLGIGVVAHEGSTVVVVLNALRLLALRR
jgi:Cd2+/Zn2+-exporting ATPase